MTLVLDKLPTISEIRKWLSQVPPQHGGRDLHRGELILDNNRVYTLNYNFPFDIDGGIPYMQTCDLNSFELRVVCGYLMEAERYDKTT